MVQNEKPIVYDGYCGLGGWSEGFLAAGYRCIGFDIEAHDYGSGGYPGELILRDMRQVHGSLLKDAACLVFSPPCQEYSYMAMPWSRAKQMIKALEGHGEFRAGYRGSRTVEQLNELFNTCYRIQREACEAAGRYIPMVIENVRGAQKWVGRAKANYGSFYLWGDVGMVGNRVVAIVEGKVLGHGVAPVKALKNGTGGSWFPQGNGAVVVNNHGRDGDKNPAAGEKVPGFRFDGSGGSFQSAAVAEARKHDGSGWTEKGSLASHNRLVPNSGVKVAGIKLSEVGFNVAAAQRYREERRESDAVKQPGIGGMRENGKGDAWFQDDAARHGSKSDSRKAASAMIAKIPYALSSYLAQSFKP